MALFLSLCLLLELCWDLDLHVQLYGKGFHKDGPEKGQLAFSPSCLLYCENTQCAQAQKYMASVSSLQHSRTSCKATG